jgi:hypothetical protein
MRRFIRINDVPTLSSRHSHHHALLKQQWR